MKSIDQDNSLLIDSVLDDALRCVRNGQAIELDSYYQRYPELADELRVMLPAMLALEKPRLESTSIPKETVRAAPAIPLNLPDFQIISELGRGAMGVVYEAIQHSLSRRVALKVLFHAGDSNAPQPLRFQREAEIAARLHHTNIVPVYEAGEAAGYVYYAMQLIEGANLQQVIAAQANPIELNPVVPQRGPSLKSDETVLKIGSTEEDQQPVTSEQRLSRTPIDVDLSPRSCAKIALQVAEGLDFAHERGILHRDIKPSNIMIDQDGRAWIADFGLAKSSDGTELTATGDVVGTVRYLAPERFRGQSDHRSDIYALGLTLYEALEGKPAFPQNDRASLIARILEGAVPLFTVKVPADLATICFKCTQQAPTDRYSTAGDLAADLRRYLDGRPIAARPLSRATRVLRWCGRNQRITALMALIVLVAGTGIVASWLNSTQLKQVTAQSEASSLLANRNQMELLKTVDRFCQTVGEDRRAYRREYRDLHNLLLESANELSTQTAGQSNAPESARIQLAGIFQRLGKMRTSDDKLADSEGFLIQALNLLLELSTETREEPDVAIELAATHRQLASIYDQMGKAEAAKGNLQESIRILEEVLERNSLTIDMRRVAQAELALTFSKRGDLLFNLRQLDESEVAMNRSIQLWEDVLLAEPENVDASFELAVQWTRLGMMLVGNLKRWREAERPLDEATKLFEFLQTLAPEQPDVNFWYAMLLTKKARWHHMAGQIEEAIATQRSAIAILDEHHRMFELDLAVQLELGIRLSKLADFLAVQDKADPEILSSLDRSAEILAQVVAADQDDLAAIMALERTHQSQAEALQQIDENARALEKVDRAIQLLDEVLDTHPEHAISIEDRYFTAVTRAELLTDLSRPDDALAEWDVALKFAPAAFVELVRMNRTRTIAWDGRHRQATEEAEAILARLQPGSRPNQHLLLRSAVTFAVAAQVVLQEEDNPESSTESEHYATRAVELLKGYQNGGGNVAKVLEIKRDLAFLSDRADFQALLQPAGSPEN